MRLTTVKLSSAVLLICLAQAALAAANPASAFETFKGFTGRWAIESDGKTLPIQMTYDVGSKGSIVTEQFGKELSVFYRDGQRLLLTHFCNAGNQPRLALKEANQPGVFEFVMFDSTGLENAGAAHVEKITYRVIDEKKIALEIVWTSAKPDESGPEKYTLTRLAN